MRALLFTVLALIWISACSKTETPSPTAAETAGPVAPTEAPLELMPAMPASGVDIHKISAGNYQLVKSEVFSRSKFDTEDDFETVVTHDVKNGEVKARHFEFAHPRVDTYPLSLTLPLTLNADGLKTIITQEKLGTYQLSRGNRAELKIEERADSFLTLFDNVLSGAELNDAGIYVRDNAVTGYQMNFRFTVTVSENSLVVHMYQRNTPTDHEGSESLIRLTFEKQSPAILPAFPAKGVKIDSLPYGKRRLSRIRTYLKGTLVADYFPSGEVSVLHLTAKEELTRLTVEYPETVAGNFGSPVYGETTGKTFTINTEKEWTHRRRVESPKNPFAEAVHDTDPDKNGIYNKENSKFVAVPMGQSLLFYEDTPEKFTEWVYEQ